VMAIVTLRILFDSLFDSIACDAMLMNERDRTSVPGERDALASLLNRLIDQDKRALPKSTIRRRTGFCT
jgi:hypothetical protein